MSYASTFQEIGAPAILMAKCLELLECLTERNLRLCVKQLKTIIQTQISPGTYLSKHESNTDLLRYSMITVYCYYLNLYTIPHGIPKTFESICPDYHGDELDEGKRNHICRFVSLLESIDFSLCRELNVEVKLLVETLLFLTKRNESLSVIFKSKKLLVFKLSMKICEKMFDSLPNQKKRGKRKIENVEGDSAEAFKPEGDSAEAFKPEGDSAEAFKPEGDSAEAFKPEGDSAEAFKPEGDSAKAFKPEGKEAPQKMMKA
jgi:hypothetical protein